MSESQAQTKVSEELSPTLVEPIWRQILNWGSVVYFLGLPALGIIIGFTHIDFGGGTQIPQFLKEFHFTVSALVATVAGLNTFERSKAKTAAANGAAKKAA